MNSIANIWRGEGLYCSYLQNLTNISISFLYNLLGQFLGYLSEMSLKQCDSCFLYYLSELETDYFLASVNSKLVNIVKYNYLIF